MYKILFLFTTALVFTLQTCNANYNLHGCEQIEPVANLDVNNLLGLWYVIQSTSSSSCVTYNFTRDDDDPSQYNLIINEQRKLFPLIPFRYKDQTIIKVTIPNPSEPGKVKGILTTNMTVFITDYENYMGLYFCKQTPGVSLLHKWSAEILSRTPSIDWNYVDKVRTRLSSYNINPFKLESVSRKGCTEEEKDDDDSKPVTESEDVSTSST